MIELDELGESLFGVVREALLIVDREGRVLKANSKAGELFRPSGGDVAGLHFSSFFSTVSAADLAVFIQDAFASRGMEAHSLRLEPEDGENILVDISASPVNSDEHGPLLMISFRDVTRYKALEEKLDKYPEDLSKNIEERTNELEEAKERYRSLFEKAAVPLAWLDTDGVLQSANHPFYELTGLDKSVEGSLLLIELIEDESYASRIARYIELLCKGFDAPSRFELEIVHSSGKILTTEWFIRFEPLTDQTLICIIDITERKKAENALRESEERYRKLLDTSPDGITVSDMNGNVIMVNRKGIELHGADREEDVVGKHVLDFIAPQHRDKAKRYMEKTLEEESVYGIFYDILRKDGTTYPAEMSASVVRDSQGQPMAFLAVTRDVTQREKAEREIRKSENRYRTLFEHSREPVYVVTKSGVLLDVNPALLEVSGYERHELVGKHVSHLYYQLDDRQVFMNKIDEAGSIKDHEIKLKKKGGEVADCLVTSSVQRDENGRIIAYQGAIRDVTERKRAEQELRQNEKRYRLLAENARDVIWTSDLYVNFTYVSPSIRRLLGYSPEEVMNMTVKDLTTPESFAYGMENFKNDMDRFEQIKNDPAWHRAIEVEFLHKSGQKVWVEANLSFMRGEDGEPEGFLGVFRDIQDRKDVQKELEESARYYRSLIENVSDIILVLDENATIKYQSPSMEIGFGYRPEEVIGKNMFDFLHPDDVESTRQNFKRLLERPEEVVANNTRVKHKDGSVRHQESVGKNLLHDPAVKGIVINSRDVTSAKLSELAAREREKNISTLLSSLSDTMIVVLDRDGCHQLVWTCDEMERKYSFKSEQITGKTFFELFSREQAEEKLELVQQVFRTGESLKKEFFVELEGRSFWHDITLSPLRNTAGDVTAVVGAIHDTSQDKELMETRRHLEDQLAQAEKSAALGELAAGVVHEINNPITAVNFYSRSLEEDADLPDYCRLRSGKIRESGERIKRLLQNLTSYSAAQGGSFQPVDINQIIVQVRESLEHELEQRPDIGLELALSEDLPRVEGSAEQLYNLFSNLAINAIHALPNDGGTVRIETMQEGDGAVVRVRDNGCGIDEIDLPQIFNPFFSKKDKGKGTGLGLAIVNRIVNKHGADLDVDSGPGKGTTFTITFPPPGAPEKTGSNGKDGRV